MKKIFIVAGEASGDLHAANLVSQIKRLKPDTFFFGLGGEKLKAQGVDLYFDIVQLAVVGFFEVLKNIGKFRKIFSGVLREVDRQQPDLAILVDYPGFNLRLACELKKRGIPVLYYISPQIWAWGQKRIKTIKSCVRQMMVLFKFEEELYRRHGIPVSFVGHPLLDSVKVASDRQALLASLRLKNKGKIISILPGSREKEVITLLPIMLEAARLIYKKFPDSNFLILRSPTVKEEIFKTLLSRYDLPLYLITNKTHDGLTASDFAIVASGTATLEAAILGTPLVIVYKVAFLTWAFMRLAIKIPYIGLVNVVKQSRFVPEFVQFRAKPELIADQVIRTLQDKEDILRIKNGLLEVRGRLGESGASLKAAEVVAKLLEKECT